MAALERLTQTLDQIRQLYAELADIGERKKEAIVHNRLNDLSQLVSRETKLLKRLASLEQERLQAVAAYQAENGLNPNYGSNLSALIRMTAKLEDKRKLEACRSEILTWAEKLRTINETNQTLVRHALDFVGFTLDLLTGGPEEDVTYQVPVQQPVQPPVHASSGRTRLFDTKA